MRDITSVSTTCTIQSLYGKFCEAPADPRLPFPVCAHHAIKIYISVKDFRESVTPTNGRRRPPSSAACIVYYLRVGDLIKIGRTTNLPQRMVQYPPTAVVLATEDGDVQLETRRLRQFNHHLQHGKEWFTPGADLLAHIDSLAANRNLKAS